jgi:hypothetical protein
MPERQRPNWLRWLLEVPQFGGRIAGLALENDHAAESRREPRRAVHVVETVDAPTAVGRFALVVQQHELDVARDDFLPDGGADLGVSDARREVFHRVSDDRSDVRADLLGEVRELIFVPRSDQRVTGLATRQADR